MTTTPTNNSIPSEAPQDLKFNAGKIDEFVTSKGWTYKDRFGVKHYTVEGLNYIAMQAIKAYGYVTIDSFEDGATITLPNQILRWKFNGEYYRWDGAFPKVVAPGSTPETTGGIGIGKWLSVGAAALASPQDGAGDALVAVKQPFSGAAIRTQHDKNADVISVKDAVGCDPTGVTDSSEAFIAVGEGAYVPSGDYLLDAGSINVSAYHGDGIGIIAGNRVSFDGPMLAGPIGQRIVAQPRFGGENNGDNIYTNSQNATQGLCCITYNGVERFLVSQRVSGTSWGTDEMVCITEWKYAEDGSTLEAVSITKPLSIGHGADLSGVVESGNLYLYTTAANLNGLLGGKGYSKINWRGANTGQSDVTNYTVFGEPGDKNLLNAAQRATVAVSSSGKHVLFVATSNVGTGRFLYVYDRKEIESTPDPRVVRPLVGPLPIERGRGEFGGTLQGVCSDDMHIYTVWGGVPARSVKTIQVYTMTGDLVQSWPYAGAASSFSASQLNGLTSKGVPVSFEPEGITLRGAELLTMAVSNWKALGKVVSYAGYNWAYTSTTPTAGKLPSNRTYWVRTQAAASGAFNSATTYSAGAYTERRKMIIGIANLTESAKHSAVQGGLTDPSTGTMKEYYAGTDAAFNRENGSWTLAVYDEALGTYAKGFEYNYGNNFNVYDTDYGSNGDYWVSMKATFTASFHGMQLRSRGGDSTLGGSINLCADTHPTSPGEVVISPLAGAVLRIRNGTTSIINISAYDTSGTGSYCGIIWRPNTDGTIPLGRSVNPWSTAYLKTAPKITSDERLKLERQGGFDDAVLDAWSSIDFKQYALLQSAYEKGAEAQWHFGVFAQRICQAFTDKGLDWKEYNIVTYFEWDAEPATYDEEGNIETEALPAGNRYHVAYDEAYAIECALNRRERARLEARVAALESALVQ